ncbi:MAG: adenine glycosylase [Coriobacteriia bacterium]|nr:adenine glycosylase [Coriobacteriia bacterium]
MDTANTTDPAAIEQLLTHVVREGEHLYRDVPWRKNREPYAIVVSEFMLQQTQVARVLHYYKPWLQRFPSFDALAAADTAEVLAEWQGLGYNRRALSLKRLAQLVSEQYAGRLPDCYDTLLTLPGIGPATAAAILAFAYNRYSPVPYLETNVRSVILHEVFPDSDQVDDKAISAVLAAATQQAQQQGITAQQWSYALLDYGTWLKKAFPNPSRRSKHHSQQSRFEGSFRQKRAAVLRALLAEPDQSVADLADTTGLTPAESEEVLAALCQEGFVQACGQWYRIAQ